MAKMLSFEIGDQSIKIIECSRKGEILSIFNYIKLDVPIGVIDDGKILKSDYLSDAIEKSLKQNNIISKKIILIINTNSVITRNVVLPYLINKKETLSMIKFELEQNLSADLNEYKLIYKTADIYNSDGIKKAKYIVHCLPIRIYNQYINLFKILKLELIAFDCSFNSLSNIVQNNICINNKILVNKSIYAFLKLDNDMLTFSVIKNGITDFSRISYLDFNELTKAEDLLEDLTEYNNPKMITDSDLNDLKDLDLKNLHLKDLNNLKDLDLKGLKDSKDIKLKGLTDNYENILIEELNKYIRYYGSISKENQIEKIFIYGTNCTTALAEFMSNILNIPVDIIRNINNIEIKKDKIKNDEINIDEIGNDEFNKTSENFNINKYFNGLLSFYNDKNDMNFLTDKNKHHKMLFNAGVMLMTAAAIIILTFVYNGLNYFINDNALKKEIETMNVFINNEENAKLSTEAENIKTNISLLEEYKNRAVDLNGIIKKEDIINSQILITIKNAAPQSTEVKSISIDKNGIQMICTCSTIQDISVYESNLKNIDIIYNVYIPSIEVQNNNENSNLQNYYFSVVCRLRGNDDEIE